MYRLALLQNKLSPSHTALPGSRQGRDASSLDEKGERHVAEGIDRHGRVCKPSRSAPGLEEYALATAWSRELNPAFAAAPGAHPPSTPAVTTSTHSPGPAQGPHPADRKPPLDLGTPVQSLGATDQESRKERQRQTHARPQARGVDGPPAGTEDHRSVSPFSTWPLVLSGPRALPLRQVTVLHPWERQPSSCLAWVSVKQPGLAAGVPTAPALGLSVSRRVCVEGWGLELNLSQGS